jgi:hypothetical protein
MIITVRRTLRADAASIAVTLAAAADGYLRRPARHMMARLSGYGA